MKKLLIANLSVLVVLVLLTGYNMFNNFSSEKINKIETQMNSGVYQRNVFKRDNILEGESIQFKVEDIKVSTWNCFTGLSELYNPQFFIISSIDDLKIANILAFGIEENYINNEKYNVNFFGENVLVILIIPLGSSPHWIRIDSLTKEQNELSINYTILVSGENSYIDNKGEVHTVLNSNLSTTGTSIEIKRSAFEGINKLSYYQTNDLHPDY